MSKVKQCSECGILNAPLTAWGDNQYRCAPCSDVRHKQIYAHRRIEEEQEKRALAEHRAAGCPDDGLFCPECCEHEFDASEGGMCLNCGANGYEYAKGTD